MWRVNKIGIDQVWYSEETINKIKDACIEEIHKYITYPDGRGGMTLEYTGAVDFAKRIMEIIKKEEGEC